MNIENVTQVILQKDYSEKIFGNPFQMNDSTFTTNFFNYAPASCVTALSDPGVQKALKEDYDYMIIQLFFTECFLSIPFTRKIPYVLITPNTLSTPSTAMAGAPDFASITPNRAKNFTFPFSFWDRMYLSQIATSATLIMNSVSKQTYNRAIEENLWPPGVPQVSDINQECALFIINSIRALEYPMRPMPPKVIYAGGIQIKDPQPLPKDLAEWLDGSGDSGFIFFSLGTAVKPEYMDPKHLSVLLDAFGSLKQRIIWKWTSKIDGLPPNIKISPWLPQQDILAHPKIRLFISHGGLFGTQEAMYFKVPVLGIPVYFDQHLNIAEIVSQGWARSIKWEDLTKQNLHSLIQEILTNSTLREIAHQRSDLMRDWPRKPKKEVAFWVDYIIRHKGAPHLKSPFVGMYWYQMYNVDVWAFIVTCLTIGLCFLFYIMKFVFQFCRGKLYKLKKE